MKRLVTILMFGIVLFWAESAIAGNSSVTVKELRCEYLVNPLGIDVTKPRLSWVLDSAERGQKQTAYQILVASSEEKLKAGKGDLWDTGKVGSDQSIHVVYAGKKLKSGMECFWKVRVWDKDGNKNSWSDAATFEMALLQNADWQAAWIGAERSISSPLLRKEFTLDKQVKRARAYVSGLGYYELYINGRKVGDHVLDPGATTYHDDLPFKIHPRVLYVTYDITDYLKTGKNAVGAMLGNGWFSPDDLGTYRLGKKVGERRYSKAMAPFGDRPILLLQINIETNDGKTITIVSDKTWKTFGGPITANNICDGEAYDARLEKPGWKSPNYGDSSWDQSVLVEPPNGILRAQMIPPIKVAETIEPLRILNPDDNVYVYDFGQHFSGWTKLCVKGPRGTKITLRYAGRLYDDNRIDTRNSTSSWLAAQQTDSYILKGNGIEEWEPRFVLHGFRYVELTRFPGTPTLENLRGRFVHTDLEATGTFSCSNSLINQIHQMVWWTFMSSFQSISQDAADRCERVGCTGDPGFVGEDYLYNFDSAHFWAKWVNDMADSQKPDGNLSVITPLYWPGRNTYQFWPAWVSNYHLFIWYLYQYYGDTRLMEQHYEGMKKYVDYCTRKADNYFLDTGMGDHMEPQEDGTSSFDPKQTPVELTATGYYYYDAWIVAQSAKILGKTEDAKRYCRLAEKIKKAYNEKYFDPVTNNYATGTQTSNAFSLYMGMVPKEKEQAVLKNLIDTIKNKHNGHLWAGIIGINALEQVLPAYGYSGVMYGIATKTTWPGWGYQIMNGATTLGECFELCSKHSLNMKMLGSIEKFLYKDLAGISPAAPAYKEITIKPQIVGDLKYAQASVKTPFGLAAVDWKKNEKSFEMKVTIPVNSTATVYIPTSDPDSIVESGIPAARAKGIRFLRTDNGKAAFAVGSGCYQFASKL